MSQWLPLIGLAAFIGIGAGWRTWLQWRRYGASGFALFRSGRWPQHVRDSLVLLLVAVLTAEGVAKVSAPALLDRLGLLTLPPLLMLHGTLDELIPIGLARSTCAAAVASGNTCTMQAVEGARHTLPFDQPGVVIRDMVEFLTTPPVEPASTAVP
jgi:pimeloyl-ACP methyl ester carboxylesterase